MSTPERIYGYPKDNGTRLTDWHGKTIAKGRKVNCTKIRRMGDGMAASCRIMKKAPANSSSPYWDKLDGARRRRRRR